MGLFGRLFGASPPHGPVRPTQPPLHHSTWVRLATISDQSDDLAKERSLELSTQLPMSGLISGQYQANESFICVQ